MNKTYKYIPLLVAAIWAGGCKDLDLAPTDRFTETTYWTSAVSKASKSLMPVSFP